MKKAMTILMTLGLSILFTTASAHALETKQVDGKYKGINGAGESCWIQISQSENWLPSKTSYRLIEYHDQKIHAAMSVPEQLDQSETSENIFYFQFKVDNTAAYVKLDMDLNTEFPNSKLSSAQIVTPATFNTTKVCYQLKKLN